MAVPFRRTSKTKKRMRRTHLKKDAPTVITCPNCGEAIQPHRACTKCGYYKGKEVIKMTKDEETKEVKVKEEKKAPKKEKAKKESK